MIQQITQLHHRRRSLRVGTEKIIVAGEYRVVDVRVQIMTFNASEYGPTPYIVLSPKKKNKKITTTTKIVTITIVHAHDRRDFSYGVGPCILHTYLESAAAGTHNRNDFFLSLDDGPIISPV